MKLLCRELQSSLENTRSFIVMDIVATIVRILSGDDRDVQLQLFPLGCDTLELVCRASLEHCPEELIKHIHTVVALLTVYAQNQAAVREKVYNNNTVFAEEV